MKEQKYPNSGNRNEIMKILKEAYEFGYFIGYKGHSEWVRWVRDKKEGIYKKAKELGIYEAAKRAYQEGKEDGRQKRLEELNLMLIERGGGSQEETQKVEVVPLIDEKDEILEEEFLAFLKSVKIVEPPKLLKLVEFLRIPRAVSSFRES